MTIASGTRLGPYTVRSLIGRGGMGEVYQAHDSRLNRDVAIKVLPEAFARDPARLARFRREAQVLASLNHPDIAAIYELEEFGGVVCLVMEYVPGETLAEALRADAAAVRDRGLGVGGWGHGDRATRRGGEQSRERQRARPNA